MTAPSFPRVWPTAFQSGTATAALAIIVANKAVRVAIRIVVLLVAPIDGATVRQFTSSRFSEPVGAAASRALHLREVDLRCGAEHCFPRPKPRGSGGPLGRTEDTAHSSPPARYLFPLLPSRKTQG